MFSLVVTCTFLCPLTRTCLSFSHIFLQNRNMDSIANERFLVKFCQITRRKDKNRNLSFHSFHWKTKAPTKKLFSVHLFCSTRGSPEPADPGSLIHARFTSFMSSNPIARLLLLSQMGLAFFMIHTHFFHKEEDRQHNARHSTAKILQGPTKIL